MEDDARPSDEGRRFADESLKRQMKDDDRLVEEHKAMCSLHVPSGSNMHRASRYDVLVCALKESLIVLDQETRNKAEAEEMVRICNASYGRAIRNVEAYREALVNITKDAIHGGPKRVA